MNELYLWTIQRTKVLSSSQAHITPSPIQISTLSPTQIIQGLIKDQSSSSAHLVFDRMCRNGWRRFSFFSFSRTLGAVTVWEELRWRDGCFSSFSTSGQNASQTTFQSISNSSLHLHLAFLRWDSCVCFWESMPLLIWGVMFNILRFDEHMLPRFIREPCTF